MSIIARSSTKSSCSQRVDGNISTAHGIIIALRPINYTLIIVLWYRRGTYENGAAAAALNCHYFAMYAKPIMSATMFVCLSVSLSVVYVSVCQHPYVKLLIGSS